MGFQKVFHPQWTDAQGNRTGQFGQIANLTDPMSTGKRIRFSFIEMNETRFFDVAYSYVSSRGFVVAQSVHFLAPADFTVLTGLPPENADLFANGPYYLAIMAMTTPDRGHVHTLRYSRMTGVLVPNAQGEQNPKSRLITWYAEL